MNKFKGSLLDKYIDEYVKENVFSGVIRVTEKDKIIYERDVGFANYQEKTTFNKNSMFSFYSLSKPFCAIGLLRLYDLGLIDIDEHPKKYLAQMNGFDEKLKIRHLLHHVSGLPDFEQVKEYNEKYYNDSENLLQELTILKDIASSVPPGTETKYANINFEICALIIEKVSGLTYEEYMRKEVFVPLGMKTACIDSKDKCVENRVQGNDYKNGELYAVDKAYRWMKGGGDIVGTVDDVYCLNLAIKQKKLLKEETWAQILTPSKINEFGMGCRIHKWHGKNAVWHNGGHYGFRTLHIQIFEDDFDLILLSNYGGGNARYDFAEAVFAARYGLDKNEQVKIKMDQGYIKEENDIDRAKQLLYKMFF